MPSLPAEEEKKEESPVDEKKEEAPEEKKGAETEPVGDKKEEVPVEEKKEESPVTGELYATRKSSLPAWESMECATANNLTEEMIILNHTTDYGASASEDSLQNTFSGGGGNFDPFYIGQDVLISDTASCYSTNLNVNGTNSTGGSTDWSQVILNDGSTYDASEQVGAGDAGGSGKRYKPWLTYAAKLQNNRPGYRNGSIYDFQILLPESGLEGAAIQNYAYYFYVELI